MYQKKGLQNENTVEKACLYKIDAITLHPENRDKGIRGYHRMTGPKDNKNGPNVKFKKYKIMKKIVLTLVAMMSMTMAFAGNTNAKAAEMENAYDMHINIRRLATTLGLNTDQMESVNDLYNNFCVEMLNASAAKDEEKSEMVDAAVKRNLTYMAYVLDNSQLKKYTLLLDTTLKNRGLKK